MWTSVEDALGMVDRTPIPLGVGGENELSYAPSHDLAVGASHHPHMETTPESLAQEGATTKEDIDALATLPPNGFELRRGELSRRVDGILSTEWRRCIVVLSSGRCVHVFEPPPADQSTAGSAAWTPAADTLVPCQPLFSFVCQSIRRPPPNAAGVTDASGCRLVMAAATESRLWSRLRQWRGAGLTEYEFECSNVFAADDWQAALQRAG